MAILPSRNNEAIDDLAQYDHWVCWKIVERKGRDTKLPVNPKTGAFADTTDSSTWGSFDEAVEYAETNESIDGIGFVFSDDDPFTGVDLDQCRSTESSELADWAARIVADLDSYSEVSPSGRGVHVLVRGNPGFDGKRSGRVEIYNTKRYFTVTGLALHGAPESIEERQSQLDATCARIFQANKPTQKPTGDDTLDSLLAELTPEVDANANPPFEKFEILCTNVPKVKDIWEHRLSYESTSEYDLALANHFLSAGWSAVEIMQGLVAHRRKYGADKLDRADYYARTIVKAHQNRDEEDAQDDLDRDALDDLPQEDRRESILAHMNTLYGEVGIEFRDVIRYASEPPSYAIVTQHGRVTGDIQLLLSQRIFRRRMAEVTRVLVKVIKDSKWHKRAQYLLDVCRDEVIGYEATDEGQARAWLINYLEAQPIPSMDFNPEAFKEGQPFRYNGDCFIVGEHFGSYLSRRLNVRLPPRQRGYYLRLLGCEPGSRSTKDEDGRRVTRHVWSIPESIMKEV